MSALPRRLCKICDQRPAMYGRRSCAECFNKTRRGAYAASKPAPKKWPAVEAFDRTMPGDDEHMAVFCEHANECPTGPCQCEPDCYCKSHTCKARIVETVAETITNVEEHRLKRRVRELEDENRKLVEQLSDDGEFGAIIAEVRARQGSTRPRIEPRERTSNLAEATPLILASDWHIEEEVRPEQVHGRNRYNLEISKHRMERFFEASKWAIDHQRQVFKIRDAILWLGGDFITNFLHPDNVESNLLHPTEAILMGQAEIGRGIEYLLEDPEIEQLIIPCNDGNHGRLTKKVQSATRTQNSLEVLMYAQLALKFADEPRVKFILPESSFTYLDDVYGRSIRFLHGDVFRYQGGIGGIMVPMFRALGRWETVKHADLTCMGHWHQRVCLPQVMVNGSLIGFNSFAQDIGANFEPPVQSLRMLEPKRWCSSDIPLWVAERIDDEAND